MCSWTTNVKWAHSSKINDSFGMHAHVLVLSFLLLIILKLEKTVKISLLFQDFFLKPRLHVRFFACDGYVIFLKLSRHQRAAKITCSTLWRSSWFCHKKFSSLNFSWFFLQFFPLSHHLCKGGYTCDFLHALVTRQFSKKWHHHGKLKIAHVAAALRLKFVTNSLGRLNDSTMANFLKFF